MKEFISFEAIVRGCDEGVVSGLPPVIRAVLPCRPKSEVRYSFPEDMIAAMV